MKPYWIKHCFRRANPVTLQLFEVKLVRPAYMIRLSGASIPKGVWLQNKQPYENTLFISRFIPAS